MDYLIECHRSTREELLFRVRHRDDYLKANLLSQAVLLALSGGVKLGGVEATSAIPSVLALAVPVALVFMCLYYRENKLVAHLSRYLASLPAHIVAADNDARIWTLRNWDASDELAEYARETLIFRLTAESIAFVLIPAGLFITWVQPAVVYSWTRYAVWGVDSFLLAVLVVVVGGSFNYLRPGTRERSATTQHEAGHPACCQATPSAPGINPEEHVSEEKC